MGMHSFYIVAYRYIAQRMYAPIFMHREGGTREGF